MKRTRLVALGLLLGLGLAALLGGTALLLNRSLGSSTFAVQGRVAGFGNDAHTVIVEHEEIPGYMPAMTMSLTTPDTAALRRLRVGDAVGFRLHAGSDSSWITNVEPLPDSLVARHPAADPASRYALPPTGVPVLQEGDSVPTVRLDRDQNGEPIQLADYRGKALLLDFIYTRCPLPDYCPRLSENFAQVQRQLPDSLRASVHLLSVSFDPENDTPAVLRNYARGYDADTTRWTFATGTKAQVQEAASRFGVFTRQENGQITHNLRTALIGPGGRVQRIWRGTDWSVHEILRAIAATSTSDSENKSSLS